ncbi:probable tRNA (guanine(26)-N(2))-dimethyltransferase [Ischnura elegans]|uniref:probable tRNA (guanine(26)-N(2))-dimethyltransferase n=1 Tax=Ischnura elegans TaxID=197161 RepID=UPI001ED888E5|nr:probable tRNA (guanine(26)-N(2))-dimethyltransferase [Ischnura elegans]
MIKVNTICTLTPRCNEIFWRRSGNVLSIDLQLNRHCISSVEMGDREFVIDRHPASNEEGLEKSLIAEGKAEIIISSCKRVFYNPVQEFNRDLSVAVLRIFSEEYRVKRERKHMVGKPSFHRESPDLGEPDEGGITILEALSASGLRSIRYAKEVPGVKTVVANDLSLKAVDSIKANIFHNGVEHIVKTSHSDASMLMYSHRRPVENRFDAIDLDPYGCPSIFLDSAVQSLADGGLMLVTATDMAVLAGNAPETCYSKYGAISLHTKACHEMALRILLQCIESHANRYGRYIVPLMSISADFYVRVFVKIFTSPAVCKKTTSKLSMVYKCTGCESITLQPLGAMRQSEKNIKFSLPTGPPVGEKCAHCGHKHHVGGPIWSAPIHDGDFLAKLEDSLSREEEDVTYGTLERMRGLVALLREELLDVPLYCTLDRLCSIIHSETMPMVLFRSALLNAGYRVSYSHACRTSVKTDAPVAFLWHIMRSWEALHPVKRERIAPTSPAYVILSKSSSGQPCGQSKDEKKVQAELPQSKDEPKVQVELPPVNFDYHPDANPPSRRQGLLRFQENPQPHWGPGTRATVMTESKRVQLKSQIKQGKKSKGVHAREDDEDESCPKVIKTE